MIGIWKVYNSRLEKMLKIEKQQLEDISKIKVIHQLSSMKPIKYFALLAGLIWVIGGLYLLNILYLHGFEEVSKFFFFSFAAQILITAIALLIYVVQLILLYSLDITEPIYSTQKKLAKLRKSTLWVAKILFLQLPFWASFQISETMLQSGNLLYLLVNGLVILIFTLVSVWLFINIRYENRDKKWFRLIFSGFEWTPIIKSEELLRQLEDEDSIKG